MNLVRSLLLPSAPGAFRLWLALLVVVHHVSRVELGKTPVLVFFALSGFWVHKVWQSRYRHTYQPWLTFIVSRWWRIAPVMVLGSAITLAMLAAIGDPMLADAARMPWRQAFSTVSLLGYAEMAVRPLGPAWSLDVEMQFYLVAPLLVLLVQRSSAVIALGLSFLMFVAGMAIYPGVVLTSFLPFFVIGMVAAQHDWAPPPRMAEGAMILAILLVGAMLLSPWSHSLLGENGPHWPQVNLLLAVLLLPQALVSARSKGGQRDGVWADQSFIVYLMHWPAIYLWRNTAWSGPVTAVIALAGLAVCVAVVCWVVRVLFDRPLNRARSRWVASRRVPEPDFPGKGDDSQPVFA